MADRVAILLDGEFIKKTLSLRLKYFPDHTDVMGEVKRILAHPDVAVRRGTLAHQGWEIGRSAITELTAGHKKTIDAKDVVPKIQQKGVDMRIGLDIASLALKRLVSGVVIVSADSDLVPAMKLARREGLRVYLDTLGATYVRPELKTHADRIL